MAYDAYDVYINRNIPYGLDWIIEAGLMALDVEFDGTTFETNFRDVTD